MRLLLPVFLAFTFAVSTFDAHAQPKPGQGVERSIVRASKNVVGMRSSNSGETCGCYTPYTDDGTFNGKIMADLTHSPAVFAGEVLNIDHIKYGFYTGMDEITFKITRDWKNADGGLRRVLALPRIESTEMPFIANCGLSFSAGETYLVFVESRTDNRLWTSSCTRTKRLLDAKDDLAALGEGQPASTNIERIEIDGEPLKTDYKIFFLHDGAWVEPQRTAHGFIAPEFLNSAEYFDVLITFRKERLSFDHVHRSAFLTDWVVGIDRKPFSSEFIDPDEVDSTKRAYYLQFEGFEPGTELVVRELNNSHPPARQ